jgi:cytochrome c oxidase assembly factor CtaG
MNSTILKLFFGVMFIFWMIILILYMTNAWTPNTQLNGVMAALALMTIFGYLSLPKSQR